MVGVYISTFPAHKRITTVTTVAKPLGRCSKFAVTPEAHKSQKRTNRVVGVPYMQLVTGLKRVTTVTKVVKSRGRCLQTLVTNESQPSPARPPSRASQTKPSACAPWQSQTLRATRGVMATDRFEQGLFTKKMYK